MKTQKKFAHILSQVGHGNTDTGFVSAGKNGGRYNTHKPDEVSWEEDNYPKHYLAGRYLENYATPNGRMGFKRFTKGPEMRVLFYAALASLVESGTTQEINIMVGLPVEVMLDKKQARKTLRELRSWMPGLHIFKVNGKEYRVMVVNVEIFSQPGGGYFSRSLDDDGRVTIPASDLKAPTTICDIGFYTNDVFTVQGGEIVGKYTGGNTAGVRCAAEQLIREIKEKYGVTLSRHQADEYLRAKKPVFSCAQGNIDIAPLVDQALSVASASIGDFLETLLGDGNQFRYMLFTGGGSALIKKELLQCYPFAQVLPNPVFANALGLARYARRAFPDASHVIGLDPGFGGFKAVSLEVEA